MRRTFLLILCGLSCAAFLPAKVYKGAEYRTKASFLYGRFDVRMKSTYKDGVLASFFTYNDNYPSTEWNEIDIEILGRYADDVQFNPISPGQLNHVSHWPLPFNPASGFHTYGFEWTPDYIAWFVDGAEVHRQTGAHIAQMNIPQKIMMNLWNPVYDTWVGVWNENVLPAFAYYDWVSYSAYTPDSGSVGTGKNFSPRWKDEFAAWDTSRWDKATHTFNGNQCDFVQANAVFRDSMLVLCLTKESPLGFTDVTPPSVKWGRAEKNGVLLRFTEELDPVSAQNPASYINSAMPVTAAVLQPDSQSVFLTLMNYQRDSVTNVIVMNVKDRFQNPSGVKNAVLIKSVPLVPPVKINCGGAAYKDFLADQVFTPATEYGHLDGSVNTNTATASGTADPELFRSEVNGPAEYRLRLPNGTYSVTLMMADSWFKEAGKRVFSVAMQGKKVISNIDLVAAAGANAAVVRTIDSVTVTEGELDIHFIAQIDNPVLNAIIITPKAAGIRGDRDAVPTGASIGQNFPNPFNGGTVIPVRLTAEDRLTIRIFDSLGRSVAVLPVGPVAAGEHRFPWNASDAAGRRVASGVYYYRVEGSSFRTVKRMLLVQ